MSELSVYHRDVVAEFTGMYWQCLSESDGFAALHSAKVALDVSLEAITSRLLLDSNAFPGERSVLFSYPAI